MIIRQCGAAESILLPFSVGGIRSGSSSTGRACYGVPARILECWFGLLLLDLLCWTRKGGSFEGVKGTLRRG